MKKHDHNMPVIDNTIPQNDQKYLTRDEVLSLISSQLTNFSETGRVKKGYWQSKGFVSGSTGWQIDAAGNAEFNSGTFRGTLTAAAINIPDTTTANSFHVDSSGNTWWGATTFAAGVASVSKSGDAIFNSITSISISEILLTTNFESTGRFTLSGNVPTFDTTGASFATTAVAGNLSELSWALSNATSQSIFSGSPKFVCTINSFSSANNGIIYVGIGDATSSGTFLGTTNHIGFKLVISGGTINLYGTQGDGTTEKATSSLTTVADTDTLDLILIVRGTTSVDYFYRKNGGTLSTKVTATGNVPTSNTQYIFMFADNQTNNNIVRFRSSGASYRR